MIIMLYCFAKMGGSKHPHDSNQNNNHSISPSTDAAGTNNKLIYSCACGNMRCDKIQNKHPWLVAMCSGYRATPSIWNQQHSSHLTNAPNMLRSWLPTIKNSIFCELGQIYILILSQLPKITMVMSGSKRRMLPGTLHTHTDTNTWPINS